MPRVVLVAALALALAQSASAGAPTPAAYARAVGKACWRAERELQRIPPPGTSLASLHATAGRVLPLLRAQLAAVRAIPAPPSEAATVKVLLRRSESSIAAVEAMANARSLKVATAALVVFLGERDAGRALNDGLGVRCAP